MKKYNLTAKDLHNGFVNKHNKSPDDWIKQMLTEGKKKEREDAVRAHIERAYDLGSLVPTDTHISSIKVSTPKEIARESGAKGIMREIKARKKRREAAVNKLTKRHLKRTFEEFMMIAEEYYRPNEKLPSGKTPVEKARSKKVPKDKLAKVKRGADNPNIDRSNHPDLEVSRHPTDRNRVSLTHKDTGIKFTLSRQKGKNRRGDNVHSMVWTHNKDESKGPMSDSDARQVVRDANRVWKQHVAHRFPHGSVAHNNPLPSYKSKRGEEDFKISNPRARIYQRWGYGKPHGNPDMPDQYARVGRDPSPKQKAKGKVRLKPTESRDE